MLSRSASYASSVVALLIWGLAAPSAGAAQHLSLAEVKARSRELQSHILGKTDCPFDVSLFRACISPYVHQLSALIRDYTVWELNDTGGDTNQLVKDLRGVEDIYQRDLWKKLNPAVSAPDSPFVYTFRRPSPAGELIVTVNHFSTGDSRGPTGRHRHPGISTRGRSICIRGGDGRFPIWNLYL